MREFFIFLKKKFTLKFPHGSTPVMVNIIGFHEKCMLVIIFVLIVVLFILAYKIFRLKSVLKKLENQIFEIA
jgi:hypothetical protein